jgi:hypothetical protein
MQNTTMQDKLTEVLGPARMLPLRSKNTLIARAKKGAQQLRAITGKPPKTARTPYTSRYVTPPRKNNPFAVHAYPIYEAPHSETTAVQIEEKPLPESEVEVSQVPPFESQPQIEGKPSEPQALSQTTEEERAPEAVQLAPEPAPEPITELPSQGEKPGISTDEEAAAPAVYIPPDLAWLQQPTPFAEPLKFIVDRVRNAKANVNFILEQTLRRQKELRVELEVIELRLQQEALVETKQRQKLKQLEEMISACSLVAEQSTTVDSELFPTHTHKKHYPGAEKKLEEGAKTLKPKGQKRNGRWDVNDQSICHKEDVLKFFAANPDANWKAAEIREQLPPTKHAHAKAYLNVLLPNLYKSGLIQRVTMGVYRALPTQ